MSGDLVSGHFPVTNPLYSILGANGNTVQPNLPVRSNLEYTGKASAADGAALVTNKLIFVPVPVDYGQEFSTVTFIPGATAPTTTHAYAAVYSGLATAATCALLGQSTDLGSTAVPASVPFGFALATKVVATPTNAPFGYLYVGIQQTGTANSAASVVIAAAISGTAGAVFTNAPFTDCSSVAATTATAPATLATPTAVGIAPLLYLS